MGTKIAIAGRIGSGKSSLASALAQYHGFRRLSIAGGLKAELSTLLGIPQDVLTKPETKGEWRRLMQEWGQARRRINPNWWVSMLVKRLRLLEGEYMGELKVVVDDMRFVNEMQALGAYGFQLVFLDCPRAQSVQYMIEEQGMTPAQAEEAANDVSEAELAGSECPTLPPHVDIPAPRTVELTDIYLMLCHTAGLEPAGITFDTERKEWVSGRPSLV